jgi:cob(I)alamin adenosyltransferase
MKIYTRGGDGGETGLYGGTRVAKHALRVTAYGEVDELNAVLGWCGVVADGENQARLQRESARLFDLGAFLASTPDAKHLPNWNADACQILENEIDGWENDLEPLKTFILPGGSELGARLHMARTVCRRAERMTSALASEETVAADHLAYLNRLSDWLFVFARSANAQAGHADIPWTAGD